jgi:hypothetical protein
MDKRRLRYFLLFFFIFDLIVVAVVFFRDPGPKTKTLDSFFQELQIVPIVESEWNANFSETSTVVVYFNSECDVCQKEALQLSLEPSKFAKTKLLLISSETEQAIREFARIYKLNADNIFFARITNADAATEFSLPHAFVFGAGGLFLREYKGLTTSTELLSEL